VEFKITDKTKLRTAGGAELKHGLKSDQLKKGTRVTVYSNDDGVMAVELATGRSPIENLGKFEQASGVVKSVDADKGTLTVAVRQGAQARDEEFKVSDKTHLLGADGKAIKGGLKEHPLKRGTQVSVFVEDGKAVAVQIGGGHSSPIETAGQFDQAMGVIKKVNTEKNVLTVDVRQGRRMGKVDFKITDKTKFLGAGGKPIKDGLKADSVKEGTVVIVHARDGVAEAVQVGR
jgi:transcription antitermination factor NusG